MGKKYKIDYNKKHIGWWYFLTIGVLVFDLVSKALLDGKTIDVINGFFGFVTVHNYGASWGMLAGQSWLFITFGIIFAIGMIAFDIFYRKDIGSNGWYKVGFTLLLGGLFGNLIDRMALGYVRDFINLEFINFPVFNIADIALTIGCICLTIFLLFFSHKGAGKSAEKVTNTDEKTISKNDKILDKNEVKTNSKNTEKIESQNIKNDTQDTDKTINLPDKEKDNETNEDTEK